jgi:hypothetical protein
VLIVRPGRRRSTTASSSSTAPTATAAGQRLAGDAVAVSVEVVGVTGASGIEECLGRPLSCEVRAVTVAPRPGLWGVCCEQKRTEPSEKCERQRNPRKASHRCRP